MSSTVEETGRFGSNSVSESLPQTQTHEDISRITQPPAAPRPPRSRKAMKPRSKVWDHFEKLVDQDGVESAKCIYCAKRFRVEGSKHAVIGGGGSKVREVRSVNNSHIILVYAHT
ncbi:hypothetical protein ACS0TY_010365 [Phlomoides rotata]